MTAIIAISGKKQAGKSSLANYLKAYFDLDWPNKNFQGQGFELQQSDDGTKVFLRQPNGCSTEVSAYIEEQNDLIDSEMLLTGSRYNSQVKFYSFADPIKEFCVDALGLKPEQVWGTDAEKNSPTKYRWEKLPATMRPVARYEETVRPDMNTEYVTYTVREPVYKDGPMTGREVMQIFGTNIMREMFSQSVWVEACIRRILKEKPPIAVVPDLRFPSELEAMKEAGAYIIRLERAVFKDDHVSETALDGFAWGNVPRSLVIPKEADIPTKNKAAVDWLLSHGVGKKG